MPKSSMKPKRAALESFSVSADGTLKNVSLITGGVEALGHDLYIDEKTIDGVVKLLLGRSLPSFFRHTGAGGDRLGQEMGFFSGIYRDGLQVRAKNFEFLDAFKKEAPILCEKLVEIAQKAPDSMGVSLVVEYYPVWVMPDGSEVQCMPDGEGECEDAPMGAVNEYPSMRPTAVYSADFVGSPAANPNGLLSVDGAASQEMKEVITIAPAAPVAEATPAPATVETATLAVAPVVQVDAPAAKETELSTIRGELAALKEAHAAELSKIKADHEAALAAREDAHNQELAEFELATSEEIARLEAISADKLGVPPIALISAKAALSGGAIEPRYSTDKERWAAYAELKAAGNEDAAEAFLAKHLPRFAKR